MVFPILVQSISLSNTEYDGRLQVFIDSLWHKGNDVITGWVGKRSILYFLEELQRLLLIHLYKHKRESASEDICTWAFLSEDFNYEFNFFAFYASI